MPFSTHDVGSEGTTDPDDVASSETALSVISPQILTDRFST